MVAKFGDGKRKGTALELLSDVDHKLPTVSESALEAIGRIEMLFRAAPTIATSDAVKLRAVHRAIEQKAPFHHPRNSINDAMLIEIYSEEVAKGTGNRFIFVTHNKRDFSDVNEKHPHPDISAAFSRIKSLYFITLAEALRRIAPELVTDVMMEEEWIEQPRALSEILNAMDLLFHQVWYNRHQNTRYDIETGKTKIVEKETFPVKDHARRPIQRDVWEGALKSAARVEREYGLENLGPWTDFEWGMVNGKLSALRWVLGDDWDTLDT